MEGYASSVEEIIDISDDETRDYLLQSSSSSKKRVKEEIEDSKISESPGPSSVNEELDDSLSEDDEIYLDEVDVEEEKIDLNSWKLEKIDEILKEMYAEIDSKANKVAKSVVLKYQQRTDEILNATFIADEIVPEECVKEVHPTKSEEYLVVENQVNQLFKGQWKSDASIKCPQCKSVFTDRWLMMQHIRSVHLKDSPFACTKCEQGFSRKQACLQHVKSKHANMKYPCQICLKKFAFNPKRQAHETGGHILENVKVFSSPEKGLIEFRDQTPDDVKNEDGRGGTYQVFAMPWKDDSGKIVDVSIALTCYGNVEVAAELWWNGIVAYGTGKRTSDNWTHHCSARSLYNAGCRVNPKEAIPLSLFAHGLIVACQLKWWVRKYVDGIRTFATAESKYFLQPHSEYLKTHLADYIPLFGQKNIDHVKLHGDEF